MKSALAYWIGKQFIHLSGTVRECIWDFTAEQS